MSTPFLEFLQWIYENKQHTQEQLRNDLWMIEHLNQITDLNDTQATEKAIINHKGKDTYKAHFALIYKYYCTYKGVNWQTPKFSKTTQEIRVPTHEKLEMIFKNLIFLIHI